MSVEILKSLITFIEAIMTVLLIPAVLLDLFSLYLGIRRNLREHSPSGVPGLSLLVYIGFIYFHDLPGGANGDRLLQLLLAIVFHVMCQFGIPMFHRWLMERFGPSR